MAVALGAAELDRASLTEGALGGLAEGERGHSILAAHGHWLVVAHGDGERLQLLEIPAMPIRTRLALTTPSMARRVRTANSDHSATEPQSD
jgi:hypothetical protein